MSDASTQADNAPGALRRYHNYPLSELWAGIVNLKANAAAMKAETKIIDEELDIRFGGFAAECFKDAEKQHGQLTVNLPGEPKFMVKAEVSKKVTWDSGMLEGIAAEKIAAGMTFDQMRRLFKITFEMPEKVYAALEASNPELKKLVDDARMVTYGDKPKLTLLQAAE